MNEAILLLSDGRTFIGTSFGAQGETIGEVCFNTGMTGYQEILTDPSYCQQIVAMTSPHIGNYGVNKLDVESKRIQVAGFIVKESETNPSNWKSEFCISEYLGENNIVGLEGIDTRALTCHIRDNGAMNGIISSLDDDIITLKKKLNNFPSMTGLDLVKKVTCKNKYVWSNKSSGVFNVAVIDYGIKYNILRILERYGCNLTVFPANVSASELSESSPDGVFLSNGPGDPSAVTYSINTVKEILGKIPIFGICLGHQILAIALGASTFKLNFGHRGINHPVKNLETGLIEITSQNHGFSVELESLPKNIVSTHINLNDNTSAGIKCEEFKAFSVQFHPESSPGPHDSRYLFKNFITMMENAKKN